MLGEGMDDEEFGQFSRGDGIMCQNKDVLLQQLIYDDQDNVQARGWRKFLNEVHGDGVPELFQDWELLQKSVGLVMLWLGLHTGGAGLVVSWTKLWRSCQVQSLQMS